MSLKLEPWQKPVEIIDLGQWPPLTRAYIAGRSCRSFKRPEELAQERSEKIMLAWLHKHYYDHGHGMLLEFANDWCFWFSSMSLGTIRDVDRARIASHLQPSTHCLDFYKELEILLNVAARDGSLQAWADRFYFAEKPSSDDISYLVLGFEKAYHKALRGESYWCERRGNPDDARGYLPQAFKTHFCMGGNLRAWMEYLEKRACALPDRHPEYVYWARATLQWFRDNVGIPQEWGNPCAKCPEPCGESLCADHVTI